QVLLDHVRKLRKESECFIISETLSLVGLDVLDFGGDTAELYLDYGCLHASGTGHPPVDVRRDKGKQRDHNRDPQVSRFGYARLQDEADQKPEYQAENESG